MPLEVDNLQDAARELIHLLVMSGVVVSPEELEGLLDETLPREVLAVGKDVFLMHFRTDAVGETAIALGVAREPIVRESDSSREARIIILVVAPHKDSSTYLQAVGSLARALSDDETVHGLLNAKTPEDVLALPALADLELPGYLTVQDFMSPRLLSVKGEMTLGEAARIMVSQNVPVLPVVSDSGEVLGIVGHQELIRFLLPRYVKRMNSGEFVVAGRKLPGAAADPRKTLVKDVMDRSVLCVSEDQTLADVAAMMVNKKVAHVPVVRDGILVGMLERDSLVRRMIGP